MKGRGAVNKKNTSTVRGLLSLNSLVCLYQLKQGWKSSSCEQMCFLIVLNLYDMIWCDTLYMKMMSQHVWSDRRTD